MFVARVGFEINAQPERLHEPGRLAHRLTCIQKIVEASAGKTCQRVQSVMGIRNHVWDRRYLTLPFSVYYFTNPWLHAGWRWTYWIYLEIRHLPSFRSWTFSHVCALDWFVYCYNYLIILFLLMQYLLKVCKHAKDVVDESILCVKSTVTRIDIQGSVSIV